MGNKVSKKNDIPEKNIWEYTMGVAPENSVEFVNKISAEPAEIKEQVERAKKLIVYTEDDLKDMVPFFIDKKTNGNLYIIAGKICKTELSETGANVTIKNRNEEKIFKINMEDSFYDKAMSAAGKDIYITALMCNDDCIDIKLGPIHGGMIGWEFKKINTSGKAITNCLIRA